MKHMNDSVLNMLATSDPDATRRVAAQRELERRGRELRAIRATHERNIERARAVRYER